MHNVLKSTMLAGAAVLALGAGLCSTSLTARAQEATFVLTARDVGAPMYNPIKATKLNFANTLIFDRLVIRDADQSFHGQLATSWESTPDGKLWTFKLRPGVRFHNGEPFNAQTIAWWVPKFAGT